MIRVSHDRPKRLWLLLLGIVAASFAFRLLNLWAVSDTPWIERYLTDPSGDDYAFFQWAKTILEGDWLGRDTYHPYYPWMRQVGDLEEWYRWWGGKEVFHQTPLFPYLLAIWLALYKGSVSLVFVTQLLVGSLHVVVMYFLAKRLFDHRVGLVAAALTACYGPFIFYQTMLLRDWLVPVLESLAVLTLLKASASGRPYAWALAGASLGVAVLCKPTALLLIPVALVWIAYEHWREWRETSTALAAVIAGCLLVLTPLLIRNAVVGAPLFALSTRAVEAFVLANNTDNDVSSIRKVLERSGGKLFGAVQETIALHREMSTSFFAKQLRKLRRLANPYELPNNTSIYYVMELSPILHWTIGYGFIFPLGVVGLLMCLTPWRHHLLVLLYGLASLLSVLLTYPIARYRLVVVPVLILYGAALLIHWVDTVRERRAARALGIAGLVLTLVVIEHLLDRRPYRAFAHDYYNSAVAYRQRNDLDKAVHEISTLSRQLIIESPDSRAAYEATGMEGDYRVEWAKLLIRKAEIARAKEQVELADAAYARDPNLVLSHFNVGMLYAAIGELEKARRSLEQFLSAAPENPKAAHARRLLLRIKEQPEPRPTE